MKASNLKISLEQKRELVRAAKDAAVAMAAYWDALRTIEVETGKSIVDNGALSIMAAECEHPPRLSDLNNFSANDVIGLLREEC